MSELKVFHERQPGEPELTSRQYDEICAVLGRAGVRFERWEANHPVRAGDDPERILTAYADDIRRLMDAEGYVTADVINLTPDHPDKLALRQKFLSEHTHSEDEVRFFVEGQGLFSLHLGEQVYEVLCTRGDLIGVPAGTPHWFDMGPNPELVAIRLFNNPEGWVANYTGSEIAGRFSRLEN